MQVKATITGKITDIFETETTKSGFQKRVMWIEEQGDSRYPNTHQVEFHKAQCDEPDRYQEGDIVKVDVEIRGYRATTRMGEERVYTTLKVNNIELAQPRRR